MDESNTNDHTRSTPHSHSEGEKLLSLYRPPTVLKKVHKDMLKAIWSLMQHREIGNLECVFCKKVKEFQDMTCHHNDGIEEHNDFSNLSPACYECNRREGWIVRKRRKAEVAERDKNLVQKDATMLLRELVDYSSGSPEMAVNDNAEVPYGNWVRSQVKQSDKPVLTKKEAINGGAFWVGVSTQATRRYLDKLTSDVGPFIEWKDPQTRIKYILLRGKEPKTEET